MPRVLVAAPRRNVCKEKKSAMVGRHRSEPDWRIHTERVSSRSGSAITNRWSKDQPVVCFSYYFVQAFQRLRIGLV
jgi:hypothetical protein